MQGNESTSGDVADRDLTLPDLWRLMVRRRFIFGLTLLFCILCGVLYCTLSTRRYQATGEILIDKDQSDALGLDSLINSPSVSASGALDANIDIQTQASLLQTDGLILKTIQVLKLQDTQAYKPHFSVIGWVMGLFSHDQLEGGVATFENSPRLRDRVTAVFRANLQVKPVAGTRLLDVTYTDPNRDLAAQVVNTLIQQLVDYNFRHRYEATVEASTWLGQQLGDIRKQGENLQAKVVALQRDSGVYTFGGEDIQGKGIAYSALLDQLQQGTAALSQAHADVILKGSIYKIVSAGDPETISELAGTLVNSSQGVTTSLSLIQNLRGQEAALNGQVEQMREKFGDNYPKLQEITANLKGVQESIHDEVGRLRSRSKSDYDISLQVAKSTEAQFANLKKQADKLNDKAIDYAITRQEAEETRTLYEQLVTRLREAGIIAGLQSNNIVVADPARPHHKPAKPNVILVIGASFFGGAVLGFCMAILFDIFDDRIRDIALLEQDNRQPLLGILPFEDMSDRKGFSLARASLDDLHSPFVEAMRSLRTSIFLARSGSVPKVLVLTSSVAGEGKTTISINLAVLAAQQGKRVLLVDSDLRRPRLENALGMKREDMGLSSILAGEFGLDKVKFRSPEGIENISILGSGPIPPYPSELLGSDTMKLAIEMWRTQFDLIILDGAPLLPVTDSILLSRLSDLAILVVRYRFTRRQAFRQGVRSLLTQSPDVPMAVVLNSVDRRSEGYYYGYSDSAYYGQGASK